MYAITGVTGKVGGAIAEILLAKGLPVRAIIRDKVKAQYWQDKGAEIAMAQLNDKDALNAAFKGVDGVFVMTPPLFDSHDPMGDHDQMLVALTGAINWALPKKVVYLSSIGAQHNAGTGAIKKLYDMEQAFEQLSMPSAAIRAGWFMENFAGSIANAHKTGKLHSFINPAELAIPMIATIDIAKLAADLLVSEWPGRRVIELEGPCKYSANDVAMVLSYHFKQDIGVFAIDENDYAAVYQSFGFTGEAATLMAEMNRGFNSGHIDFTEAGAEKAVGQTLLEDTLGTYLTNIS